MRWGSGKGEQYFRCLPAIYYGIVQRIFAAHVVAANGKARYHPEVVKSLKFVLPAVAAASFTVWLLRDFAIWLLLSNKFTAMRDLFAWQLVGDVLKVGAYVFGYLVIAKASLRFYILAEVSQFTLLMVFAHWLIPAHGALGAAQAYMATYIVYFSLCCGVFLLWRRRA